MKDEEHARKYARESISLAISMYNPKAEDIAFFACLYGLTYKNNEIKELEQQVEKAVEIIRELGGIVREGVTCHFLTDCGEILYRATTFLKEHRND